MARRVTIKSIADDLGVSHMTVSRALSGHPSVEKQKREAIRKRAKELGYVRSAAARAMRGDTSPIIGLLVPNITNDFYARFSNTLAAACSQQDLQLIIHLTKDDPAAEREAVMRLQEIQARAIVTVPAPGTENDALFADLPLEVVQLIRYRDGDEGSPCILVDDFDAIRHAVMHLHKKGHRAIAYIGAPETTSSGRARLAAFKAGVTATRLTLNLDLMFTDAPSAENGLRITSHIISGTEATALVCGGFEISSGAIRAAMEQNALNSRLEIVGYGDPDFYAWIAGGVTTVSVPVDELAHAAFDIIAGASAGERKTASKALKAQLLVRDGA
ncbi:MAG: LacI family DNA-binding transcriptional regulator [Pseudomonadota bacterium]